MKKLLVLVAGLIFVVAFAGCDKQNESDKKQLVQNLITLYNHFNNTNTVKIAILSKIISLQKIV